MKDKTDLVLLIEKCFYEFCEVVGDSPCGCDACKYSVYNSDSEEDGCFKEYKKDKLSVFRSE